ncbi:Sec-independent protein translocase protein TatB [Methyloglobulus sp.]|uniref:Sec-independent protein translocase protein TatB n=1 Tax=Methyloglobulus sp. TaxID=2518622 RepID=UPI003989624E
MFDIGFSELCMVGLVALLVIGPEKLPKVARVAGFWIAKSKRMMAAVKQEINEEFQAEELRQALKNQTGINEFQKILDDTSNDLRSIKDSINQRPEATSLTQKNLERDEQQ